MTEVTKLSRNSYIVAIIAGLVVALPVIYLLWGLVPFGLVMFSPLIVFPIVGLVIAARERLRRQSSVPQRDVSPTSIEVAPAERRKPVSKQTLRIASVVTVFLIPGLLLGLLPLAMYGQLEQDYWPTATTLISLGFVVSIPMAIALFVASVLP